MPKLPVLSGRDMIDILKSLGFVVVRQKGSHVSLQKGQYKTVIPLHDDLAKVTILGILKQCGLSKDDIIRYER